MRLRMRLSGIKILNGGSMRKSQEHQVLMDSFLDFQLIDPSKFKVWCDKMKKNSFANHNSI